MAEFYRYCPLCGKKLKSDGVASIVRNAEQECYLCLHVSHYPLALCELRSKPDLFSRLTVLQEGGTGITNAKRHCFFCGRELELCFTYEDSSHASERKNIAYYMCCDSRVAHAWRETCKPDSLDTAIIEEQDFETIESIYYSVSNQGF